MRRCGDEAADAARGSACGGPLRRRRAVLCARRPDRAPLLVLPQPRLSPVHLPCATPYRAQLPRRNVCQQVTAQPACTVAPESPNKEARPCVHATLPHARPPACAAEAPRHVASVSRNAQRPSAASHAVKRTARRPLPAIRMRRSVPRLRYLSPFMPRRRVCRQRTASCSCCAAYSSAPALHPCTGRPSCVGGRRSARGARGQAPSRDPPAARTPLQPLPCSLWPPISSSQPTQALAPPPAPPHGSRPRALATLAVGNLRKSVLQPSAYMYTCKAGARRGRSATATRQQSAWPRVVVQGGGRQRR
jgi:hypothetical protein